MPELPEVEIVKQSLDKKIKFKKIKRVIVRNRNLRFRIPKNFEVFLKDKNIKKISRFSKYIILHFDDDSFCIIHLGMSGTIHLVKNYKKKKFTNLSFYQSPILSNKHNHIEIQFQNFSIIYNDPRRFGFFELIKNNQLVELECFSACIDPYINIQVTPVDAVWDLKKTDGNTAYSIYQSGTGNARIKVELEKLYRLTAKYNDIEVSPWAFLSLK